RLARLGRVALWRRRRRPRARTPAEPAARAAGRRRARAHAGDAVDVEGLGGDPLSRDAAPAAGAPRRSRSLSFVLVGVAYAVAAVVAVFAFRAAGPLFDANTFWAVWGPLAVAD